MKNTPRTAQVERFIAGWSEMGTGVAAHYRAQGLGAEMARAAALGAMTQALLRRFAVEEETARTGMPPLGLRLVERLELFLDGFVYSRGGPAGSAGSAGQVEVARGAITPEVVGEACEALCAAADFADHRQGAGIFYTEPQEIDFMCRLTLGQYLAEELPEVAPSLWYQALLARGMAAAASDAALARAGLWPAVIARLGRLTVLDPACGSGSFLVGMLRVLADLMERADRAEAAQGRTLPSSEVGREGTGPSLLCGVDVMPWAVAVTRLRGEAFLREARWERARPGLALRTGDALLLDWERGFPMLWGEAAKARGCDVVIGNPPYVRQEAIGDPARPGGDREGRRRYKERLAEVMRRVHPEVFSGAGSGRRAGLDRKSDLYVYFFLLAGALVRPGGTLCLLTPSAWLDASYGRELRAFLAGFMELTWVIDNRVERAFRADVNTVITLAVRPAGPPAAHPLDDRARFVSLRQPLAQLDTAEVFARLATIEDHVATAEVQALAVARETLGGAGEAWAASDGGQVGPRLLVSKEAESPGGPESRVVRSSWGGPLLRAPSLWRRLESTRTPLVPLGASVHWRLGRGRRTGADEFFCLGHAEVEAQAIAPQFVRPLVRSPAEFLQVPPRTAVLPPRSFLFLCDAPPEALRGTGAGRQVESGVARQLPVRLGRAEDARWYFLGAQPPAHVLLPIAFHDRYFVVLNDAGWEVHQRFAVLSLTREALPWARALCALLCAQPVVLCVEILGRRSLGQGVLDVPPETWRQVLLPDPARLGAAALEALANAWERLADRPPLRLAAAAEDEAQRELDELVLNLLGWPRTERAALYEETLDWLAARLIKAGTRPAGR